AGHRCAFAPECGGATRAVEVTVGSRSEVIRMAFHSFTPDRDAWKTDADEILFANPYLEVHHVTVTSPSRPELFTWTVCHRKAAVVVAAQDPQGRFIMVRQERVPIRSTIWEFPAGQIDEAT